MFKNFAVVRSAGKVIEWTSAMLTFLLSGRKFRLLAFKLNILRSKLGVGTSISVLALVLANSCGIARAGVVVSAGEEFNYTFDFRDYVAARGPGYGGFFIEGVCRTYSPDAQIWMQQISSGGGSVAGGIGCTSTGEMFRTGGDNIFSDDDGVFTASLKVYDGSLFLYTLIGTYYTQPPPNPDPNAGPEYYEPVRQIAFEGRPPQGVPLPGTSSLLAITALLLALLQRKRLVSRFRPLPQPFRRLVHGPSE